METAYLHLITNHIPIIGVPFAIALLAFGLWRKSDELMSAALVALVGLGLATILVYLLGQGGEDFVEDIRGVSHDAIEDHEEVATFALASVLVTSVPAAFALIRYRVMSRGASTLPRWIGLVTLAFGVLSSAILGYTGRLGGKIRHTEFHQTAVSTDADGERESGEGGRRRGRSREDR